MHLEAKLVIGAAVPGTNVMFFLFRKKCHFGLNFKNFIFKKLTITLAFKDKR
jgi:hypothetical protein